MLVSPYFIHAYIYFLPYERQLYAMRRSSRPSLIALWRWLFLFLLTFCDPDAFRNIFMLNHSILDSLCHLLVAVHLLVACMY